MLQRDYIGTEAKKPTYAAITKSGHTPGGNRPTRRKPTKEELLFSDGGSFDNCKGLAQPSRSISD